MLVAGAVSLSTALAQAPNGFIEFDFSNPEAAVWDLGGGYGLAHQIIGTGGTPVAFNYGISLSHTSSGRLFGRGLTLLEIGSDSLAAGYEARGVVYGGGVRGPTRVKLSVVTVANDIVAGRLTRVKSEINYRLHVDNETRQLLGIGVGTVQLQGMGSLRVRSDIAIPLPAGMDGSWTLQMNITPLQKLLGNGSIILSNGRVLPLVLSGRYYSTSAVSLIGTRTFGEERGSSYAILFDDAGVRNMGGTILGQRVDDSPPVIE